MRTYKLQSFQYLFPSRLCLVHFQRYRYLSLGWSPLSLSFLLHPLSLHLHYSMRPVSVFVLMACLAHGAICAPVCFSFTLTFFVDIQTLGCLGPRWCIIHCYGSWRGWAVLARHSTRVSLWLVPPVPGSQLQGSSVCKTVKAWTQISLEGIACGGYAEKAQEF